MRKLFLAMAALASIAFISGCNTSEALTPPASIGGAGAQQAASPDPAAGSPAQTSLAAEENRNISTQQTAFPDNVAANGADPQQPAPENTGPRSPMLGSPGGVSATRQSIYQASNQQMAAPAATASTAPATLSGGASIRFLPIIGAPIGAVTPLSRELATAAAARGIAIKPSSDNSAQHMLKGYFSAFDDGGGTTITYVWDVLDPSGSRLTRIQGQEKIAGKSSDPWANVPPATMTKIANETIAQYTAWASANRG